MFFDSEIQEEAFMNEQLMKIEDAQARKEAAQLTEHLLLPFYREMEKAYRKLEERLFQEEKETECYQVITSIRERRLIDEADPYLQPIHKEDLQPKTIQIEELKENWKKKGECTLFSIYYEDSYEKLQELLELRLTFAAEIHTAYGTYIGRVRLEENHAYQADLRTLYESFVQNGTAWRTIHIPFIHKLLDVVLLETELPSDEEIQKIQVDFGTYQSCIKYDCVPLWNVRCRRVKTSAYPRSCRDGVHYEHTILGSKLQKNCSYMVKSRRRVWRIARGEIPSDSKHKSRDLVLECDERKPTEWELWEFAQNPYTSGREFEQMENEKLSDSRCIRTQAQAIHFANELSTAKYLKLLQVTSERPEGFWEDKTYDMDDFLTEGIRQKKQQPKLYFDCMAVGLPEVWKTDFLSYLLSRFQYIYPEYHCVGRIKEGIAHE